MQSRQFARSISLPFSKAERTIDRPDKIRDDNFGSEYEKFSIAFGSHAYPIKITAVRKTKPSTIDL